MEQQLQIIEKLITNTFDNPKKNCFQSKLEEMIQCTNFQKRLSKKINAAKCLTVKELRMYEVNGDILDEAT